MTLNVREDKEDGDLDQATRLPRVQNIIKEANGGWTAVAEISAQQVAGRDLPDDPVIYLGDFNEGVRSLATGRHRRKFVASDEGSSHEGLSKANRGRVPVYFSWALHRFGSGTTLAEESPAMALRAGTLGPRARIPP